MTFKPGDHVHVPHLGKGIVREVRRKGQYIVEVKGRSMVLLENQLHPLADGKRRVTTHLIPPSSGLPRPLLRPHALAEIDLHGMTILEAVAALDAFLNEALLAGLDEVRVIHGRSGGRVKGAVHQRLSELPSIRHFRLDASNPGVTIVAL